MAFNSSSFSKDKPKVTNVYTMCCFRTSTGLERRIKIKKTILLMLVLALCMVADITKADFTFGIPTNLGPIVNSSSSEWGLSFSTDYLEMFFVSNRPGGFGDWDIWVTTRETVDDDWGTPLNLGAPVNSSFVDITAAISPNGLELYFSSTRPGGIGHEDIWRTRRESKDNIWGPPVNLGQPANSSTLDYGVFISEDGLELYFNSMRPGGVGSQNHDLYVMRRATISEDWGAPVNLGPVVNGPSHDVSPSLSADGRYLFFSDHPSPYYIFHSGGFGLADIWVTTRATREDDWGEVVNLGPNINSPGDDCFPKISPDGLTLYFSSARSGGSGNHDLWQAPIIPIVDLNGDGIVDAADLCVMVDYWGTDESLCDIGPMPWGDGVVDVEDMKVLAKHLFEDYRLIAHWELNETEGSIAYDSIRSNDGTCHGEPLWVPAGGKIGGALQFDGVDDYVSVPFILNPGVGSFSVFTWLKGGTPGQAILSQANSTSGSNSTWLGIDPSDGKLITKLMHPPFPSLESDSVITDGQWHHVGLVYDLNDFHRRLYVDGALVIEDTSGVAGVSSDGGLYVGASKDLEAGSFFSGLIDDVCIYNGVLSIEEIEALVQ